MNVDRVLISGLKEPDLGLRGLGGNVHTDVRTDVKKFTPVSYRTSALWGRAQKGFRLITGSDISEYHGYYSYGATLNRGWLR